MAAHVDARTAADARERAQLKAAARDAKRAKAFRLFADEPDLTNRDVAERLGLGPDCIGVWRKEFRKGARS